MMDGITVLSQSEIMNTPNWTYIITIIALIALFVSMIITFSFHHNRIETIFGISSICCSILFNVGLFCMGFIEIKTGKYIYKITISFGNFIPLLSYNFNCGHYNIIYFKL